MYVEKDKSRKHDTFIIDSSSMKIMILKSNKNNL